ncbi:Erythrocyte band 7 integral membrane protein [Liparis tanakae]|uniref:Erythrocyte band 7 integral membrane protein n=1 Tax=Liparis tanakae TaxID=230148 RepID=A0A4Z2ICG5_9TELE|nr:Erythrocyte band 7 integral membrane protein [Liparis tanakae]
MISATSSTAKMVTRGTVQINSEDDIPGLFFVLPCTDTFVKVDLRTVSFDIPPQEILTKDSVTVSVDGVVYFRINCPISSVANVSNAHSSTRLLAQTTLRNVLGTKNLAELLSDREGISLNMQASLDDATDPWGIKVERVEIKDVKLPHQLQRAMAAEAEATREARAKALGLGHVLRLQPLLQHSQLPLLLSPQPLQLGLKATLQFLLLPLQLLPKAQREEMEPRAAVAHTRLADSSIPEPTGEAAVMDASAREIQKERQRGEGTRQREERGGAMGRLTSFPGLRPAILPA